MTAYYNEIDPFAAQWLHNLIDAGHIARGDVDERDIREVQPDDIKQYTQVHLFSGIGGWSYALRLAGWPDDRPVWTGSCPCQPFSSAGKQLGTDDPRHLWPEMFRLIRECRPAIVFGEQVRGAARRGWLDGVYGDLEGVGYAIGSIVCGARVFGAYHERSRLWFVADAEWNKQSRQEPCCGATRRVGRIEQPVPWDESWPSALSRFRDLGDGLPRCVEATDAIRNAIVPQVAAEFIAAYMEVA